MKSDAESPQPDALDELLARAETELAASRELDFLADLAGAAEQLERPRATLHVRKPLLARAWLLPAAATVLFALALGLWLARGNDERPAALALGEPPVFVGSALRGEETLADEFVLAMEPYTRGVWSEARGALESFLARNPDLGPAHFYLAVTLAELGEHAPARAHYGAATTSELSLLAEHARYRLALLDLVEGRFVEAERSLAVLAAGDGVFKQAAQDALLEARRR
jgi:hypothetical protein